MIKFYLICIFLCAPFFIKAQTKLADSLFTAGQYLQARVEYERLLYLGLSSPNELLLKKSYCLKAQQQYEEAYHTLQRADFFKGSDSLQFKLYYESALNAYLSGKYDLCLNKIQEEYYYLPQIHSPFLELLEIMTLNQQQNISEANEKYNEFVIRHHLSTSSPYTAKKFRKLKNPERAESMSHLLPGVGQLYAGFPGRGITSLAIQAGLVTFAGVSFLNGYYFSGAFTGVGLFYMFNNGGARHAHYLAEKKNREIITKLNNEIKKIASEVIK
ncbi:MAG: hypothetical protein JSS93_06440 [Bacteroidetes bacterium]|nr:hypothetical protein [Bacteroidota bacterium]